MAVRSLGFLVLVFALSAPANSQTIDFGTEGDAAHFPAPDPPTIESSRARDPARAAAGGTGAGAALTEWALHKTADGLHPDANEQLLLWFMNEARQDPVAEGVWLATSSHPDVAGGRSGYGVDLDLLQAEFAAIAPAPPAAFDRRLYEASLAHSLDLIDRDEQDHEGQFDRVDASGFVHDGGRASVFSFADSALNAHAAFNIDWGPGDGTGMQPGRGHRAAIMGDYSNVGIAMVPEGNPGTEVGPLVTSAVYLYAYPPVADHYNRFLVGTVWEDLDEDGAYDPGEGLGDVTVTPSSGSFFAVTGASGGYAIPILAPGSYDVTFSGGDLAGSYERTIAIGATSELLDLDPLEVPEPGASLLAGGALVALAWIRRKTRSRTTC